MLIEWQTDREPPGTHDTRFGVEGQRRFELRHVEGLVWRATDAAGPEESPRGTYTACVMWCWGKVSGN